MRKTMWLVLIIWASCAQAKTYLVPVKIKQLSAKDKIYTRLAGGDTLLIEPGSRGALQFADLAGSPGNYITIMNGAGQVNINSGALPYGISMRNCHYIKLTGSGSPKSHLGIKIAEVGHGGAGLGISERSDNIEVCFLEISHTEGPGILCKTNPDCLTNRDNYAVLNTSIHNNYVHHTGTEGMYIGSTAFEGTRIKCNADSITEFPPLLKNVEVYENLVEFTGWDGIQISYSLNVKCFRNNIHQDSQKDQPWQNCGLIIGGGASGRFYENIISDGKGFPINCFGTGDVVISNNRIFQDSTSDKVAIYINDKLADKQTQYLLENNTIQTRHSPAITVVNNKNRKPDFLRANKTTGIMPAGAISWEGTKPEIQ